MICKIINFVFVVFMVLVVYVIWLEFVEMYEIKDFFGVLGIFMVFWWLIKLVIYLSVVLCIFLFFFKVFEWLCKFFDDENVLGYSGLYFG